MDSDLDYYQRNMVPSDFDDDEDEDEDEDDDGCDDYSLEEGWPDEDEEAA